jgi:hypothetical protein
MTSEFASAPYDIFVGSADVWVAPVGTAFPAIDAEPGSPWVLVGTRGAKQYSDSGLTIRSNITTNAIRSLGSILTIKNVRSDADFQVEFVVMDTTPDQLAISFGTDPSTIDDNTDDESFAVNFSPIPLQRAVLVRTGQSPFGAGANSQLEIAAADQLGSAEGAFSKTEGLGFQHLWSAVEPQTGDAVTWRMGKAAS